MHSLAVAAYEAQNIHGYQHGLSPSAVAGQWKIEQNDLDGIVYISQNGGGWVALGGGGGGGSLDAAYIVGAQINVTDAIGPVILDTRQTVGNVLQITAATAPVLAGALTGISIDLSGANHGGNVVQGLFVRGASTTAPKASGQGLVYLHNIASKSSVLQSIVRNKSALAGSLWSLGWDSTDFAGTPLTASVLDDQTHMVTLDGSTWVDALTNSVEFINMRILMPESDVGTSAGISIEGTACAGNAIRVLLSGTLNANQTVVGVEAGPSTAPGKQLLAYYASSPTDGTGLSTSALYRADHRFTAAGTSGFLIYMLPTALTAAVYGFNVVDNSGFLGAGSVMFNGYTTSASHGVFVYCNPAVASSAYGVIAVMGVNNTGFGLYAEHNGTSATTSTFALRLTGSVFATAASFSNGESCSVSPVGSGAFRYNNTTKTFQISVDGGAWTSLVTSGGVTLDGAYNFGGAGAGRTITTNSNAVVMTSAAADNNGILELTKNPAGAQTGNVLTLSATPGASAAMFAQSIRMGSFVSISGRALDINWQALAGCTGGIERIYTNFNGTSTGAFTYFGIGHDTATFTVNAAVTGAKVDLDTNFNAVVTTSQINALSLLVATTSHASSSALTVTSKQRAGAVLDLTCTGTTGTPYGVKMVMDGVSDGASHFAAVQTSNIGSYHFRSNTTGNQTVNGFRMFYGDWSPATGPNSNSPYMTGSHITFIPTTTRFSNSYGTVTGYGYRFESYPQMPANSTPGDEGSFNAWNVYGTYVDHTPTAVNAGSINADNFVAHYFTVNPLTTGTRIVKGLVGVMGTGCTATCFAADLSWQSTVGATEGVVRIALDRNGTSSSAQTILKLSSKTASYTLGAALTGLECNVSSNILPGAQPVTGVNITVGATTAAFATTSGALVITSSATRAASVMIQTKMESGSGAVFFIGYLSATTLTGPIFGSVWDYSTGVTAGANQVIGVLMKCPDSSAAGSLVFQTQTRQKAGTIWQHNWESATTLSGAVKGFYGDFSTNLTPSNNAVYGIDLLFTAAGSSGANQSFAFHSLRSGTLTTGSNFTGYGISIESQPGRAAGAATENGILCSLVHSPSSGSGGALTDTTTVLYAETSPFSANASICAIFKSGANATASCVQIANGGTGAALEFTAADAGALGHLRGPTTGSFGIYAGTTSGTTGRHIEMYASGGAGGGVGGSIKVNPGAGNGGAADGGVLVGPALPCYMELYEMTAPAVAATNGARLFAVDNGAGKTVLKVQFQSGAAQTIATEP